MKKQYINPTMDVVAMKMQQSLMAGSLSVTVDNVNTQSDSDALGREYDSDDWDD